MHDPASAPVGTLDRVVLNGAIHWRSAAERNCLQNDTLYVADWTGPAYATEVVPYAGEARSIEDLFLELQGPLVVDGVAYHISDGVFKSLHGVRAWVAVHPRRLRASPAALHVVLFERKGAIYYGGLQKAQAPAR